MLEGETKTFQCADDGVIGRFVIIEPQHDQSLSLCEVGVEGGKSSDVTGCFWHILFVQCAILKEYTNK